MTPADIDAIEAAWHRLGVLMQMTVPDAAEVERQYAACLQTVPVLIDRVRFEMASATAAWESEKQVSAVYDRLDSVVWNAGIRLGLDVDEKGFRREDAAAVVAAMESRITSTAGPAVTITADDAVHIEYEGEA